MFFRIRTNKHLAPIAVIVAAFLLSACGEDTDETTGDATSSIQAVPVFSVSVNAEELVSPITGTGTIAAQKTTDVGPLVDGIIEEVFVRVGDKVAEGAPLFKTRDVELRIRVRELENEFKLAEAEARNTRRELDRIKELQGKGVASIGQLDNVQTKADIASARVVLPGPGWTVHARRFPMRRFWRLSTVSSPVRTFTKASSCLHVAAAVAWAAPPALCKS